LISCGLELIDAEPRKPYRISRSNRKKKESYEQNFDYDTYQGPQNGHSEIETEGGDEEYHTENVHSSKPGYSEGSGLRSIAQGSADQANSAVANQVPFLQELVFEIESLKEALLGFTEETECSSLRERRPENLIVLYSIDGQEFYDKF
jgi:hypothetical protein